MDRAIQEYERLTELDTRERGWRLINPIYHYRLAKLYEEKERVGNAIREYKKFVDICGGFGDDSNEILDARRRLQELEKRIG